jgi:hypothetical protein
LAAVTTSPKRAPELEELFRAQRKRLRALAYRLTGTSEDGEDVLGYSARETAERMGATEGSVRVAHLRARRTLEPYDAARTVPTLELRARHQSVLERFLAALLSQDARALEAKGLVHAPMSDQPYASVAVGPLEPGGVEEDCAQHQNEEGAQGPGKRSRDASHLDAMTLPVQREFIASSVRGLAGAYSFGAPGCLL